MADADPAGGQARTCPSALAEPGNLLYGRVVAGRVERLGTALPVTPAFVAAIAANGPPEARFRFAGRCIEGGCGQWANGRCGVIDRVLAEHPVEADGLPRCFIRASCRWFAQVGADACAACTLVVTDRRAEAPAPTAAGTAAAPAAPG